jgi:CPA2 family monovalent cation:H+ antiporter-2
MSSLSSLIIDLALILTVAAIMTLLFKKLKQPLVLGYVVAGFLTSPHMPYLANVTNVNDIQTWADIGVIFLLFALGLEFSPKKIMKVGGTAIIASCTIIFCMMLLGFGIGMSFGWGRTNALFLGGMIAMSSTTIIYKAFEDMGLLSKYFTGVVLSILILEDVLAVVLMVMLSTVAVSHNIEGGSMLMSMLKLAFFLVLWFVVGLFVIPLLLKYIQKLMNDEMLLIVALALCLTMVVIAAKTGFSAALGAFIMGSILSETVQAEKIGRLVEPVKDLFGAIFFVSVGMIVDPSMLVHYAFPILIITIAVVGGQAIFGTFGVLLAGQSLKTSLQCGFSLTQIGEFAFIIASMGLSLKVTGSYLYPIVVAVSVITTFITPYMIRLAEPVSNWVDNKIPDSWRSFLVGYTSGLQPVNKENLWRKLIVALLRIVVVYTIVSLAVIMITFHFVNPFILHLFPGVWGRFISAILTIICVSPFLRAIMMKKNHSIEFVTLWEDNRYNRGPLVSTIFVRILLAGMMLMYIIYHYFRAPIGVVGGLTLIVLAAMSLSRGLKRRSILIERTFFQNLRQRDIRDEFLGRKKPAYATALLTRDLHLSNFVVPSDSLWAGRTLADLNLGKEYGVRIVSIIRGERRINIPGGTEQVFPQDRWQVIGTDEELKRMGDELNAQVVPVDESAKNKGEMILRQLIIEPKSIFLGKTIGESGIRDTYRCLIAGLDRKGESIVTIRADELLLEGDVLWVVGEHDDIYHLLTLKAEDVVPSEKLSPASDDDKNLV